MDLTFDQTFESDMKELMKEVPPQIRAVFASGKIEIVAKSLMQKYRLHVDQGAITEREIILLLLGLKNPTEFTQALAEEARLDQQTINSITKDVNDQIFVPLREEMRKGPQVQQAAPAPSASWRTTQGTARERVMPQETIIIPANPQMPQSQQQMTVSIPRYTSYQKQPPPRPTQPTRPVAPMAQKPTDANRMLEDHEEPHIEFKKAPPPPTQPRPTSPNPFGAFSANKPPARTAPPPPNLPGQLRPPEAFGEGGMLPPAPPKATQGTAPVQPYSTDPYREPIE